MKTLLKRLVYYSVVKKTIRILTDFAVVVIFPIRDHLGNTVAFSGRVFREGKPKYLNSPETSNFSKKQNFI